MRRRTKMEKTEMMKRFEEETGGRSTGGFTDGFHCVGIEVWHFDYIAWLEAKAEAYDRLMSGGKKTLKELANILGKPVAIDIENRLLWFPKKPEIGWTTWIWYDGHFGCFGEELPKYLIAYSGNWRDSLTLPEGWEDK
jgi:hypothetical protein